MRSTEASPDIHYGCDGFVQCRAVFWVICGGSVISTCGSGNTRNVTKLIQNLGDQ